jgi:hypothetical protein
VAGSDEGGCGLVVLGVLALYFFVPASWTNGAWYGVRYNVEPGKVDTDPRPKDCDFIHAPLGDKGCSYKAHVRAYNAAGVLVGGEDAPKYGHDTKTGKPILSYDDGKTWDWYSEAKVPDPTVASVRVFWLREKAD